MERKFSILVVGSMIMDLVLQTHRMPMEGETLIGESYSFFPGGKGANQAVAAARLGAKVTFVGKIGEDVNGAKLRKNLETEKIETGFLKTTPESPTGLGVIILEATGQNRIIIYPGANMDLNKADISNAFQYSYDAVILQLEIPTETVIETCRLAKQKGIPIILDAGPARPFPLEEIKGLTILSPNETEAFALTGIEVNSSENAVRACALLQEKSAAQFIILKMGAQGALLYNNGQAEFFKGHKVKVVDTTAAGDAFTAALTFHYLQTGDIQRAVRYANVAGALTVTKLGAQTSIPSLKEVQEFIRRENISC